MGVTLAQTGCCLKAASDLTRKLCRGAYCSEDVCTSSLYTRAVSIIFTAGYVRQQGCVLCMDTRLETAGLDKNACRVET